MSSSEHRRLRPDRIGHPGPSSEEEADPAFFLMDGVDPFVAVAELRDIPLHPLTAYPPESHEPRPADDEELAEGALLLNCAGHFGLAF